MKFLSQKQIPEQCPTQREETTLGRNNHESKEPSQNFIKKDAILSLIYQGNELLQISPHRKSYVQKAAFAFSKVKKENT